jgi:cell division protein FtsQ
VGTSALVAGVAFGDDLIARLSGLPEEPLEVIAVRGARQLTPFAVASAAAVAPGSALGELEPEAVARALARHEWIASARALILPGGTLVLGVVEREPLARVAIGEAIYAVDGEGRPFARLPEPRDPRLPEIVAQGELVPGEPDPGLAEAVRLARRLPQLGLAPPRQVEVAAAGDARGYALRLATPDTLVVLGREELGARLDGFARLLALRPDDVAAAAEIDVRFADQLVLRSAPARDGSAAKVPGRGSGPVTGGRPTG